LEYLVWINDKCQDIALHLKVACDHADTVIIGNDVGIFDAMNKALLYAKGEYVLFLNARDEIIEPFDLKKIAGPCLIPVIYRNYFGRLRLVPVSKTVKMGIPYCHQGMILPRKGYYFDIRFKYGADYAALLNFNFRWPLPILESGLIKYDTTGVSTLNRWESDKWTALIIKEKFGVFWALLYLSVCLMKLGIKRLYRFGLYIQNGFSLQTDLK